MGVFVQARGFVETLGSSALDVTKGSNATVQLSLTI